MPDVHLTSDQLAAVRDDELRDWALIRHLQFCPECQARLREARTLRVLLTRSESVRSPHPTPEELAEYAEGGLLRQNIQELETHVATCPQCLADLDAIRSQPRPAAAAGDAPPNWVVAAAARQFQPPRTPLSLGTLFVEWLHRFGLSLELIPPVEEGPLQESLGFPSVTAKFSLKKLKAMAASSYEVAALKKAEFIQEDADIPPPPSPEEEPEEQESEPVEIIVGDLLARITVRGRAEEQVKMIIVVTRRLDDAPVAGVQLALETDQRPLAEATTDAAGAAEFLLPQGDITLTFLSPVHAELTITF